MTFTNNYKLKEKQEYYYLFRNKTKVYHVKIRGLIKNYKWKKN